MNQKRPWWLSLGESIVEHLEVQQGQKPFSPKGVEIGPRDVRENIIPPNGLADSRQHGEDPEPSSQVQPQEDKSLDSPSSTVPLGMPTNLTASPAASRSNPPTAQAPGTRECVNCRHYRAAHGPLSNQVLRIMPTRTMANSKVIQEVQRAEDQQIAEEINALPGRIDSAQTMAMAEGAKDASASSRPLAHSYCGQYEMNFQFEILEIKNLDKDCSQYDHRAINTRSCHTCGNLEIPPTDLVGRIQKPFTKAGAQGTRLYEEAVQQPLKLRADLELDEVIRRQGRVTDVPAHFPYCRHFSDPSTGYVIGPIVNQGQQCEAWIDRDESAQNEWTHALEIIDNLQEKLNIFLANAPSGMAATNVQFLIRMQVEDFERRIRVAEVQLVREALKGLGFDAPEAESIADRLASAQESHRITGQ